MNKICTKCKGEKPATTDFFCVDKDNKDGLRSNCKQCDKDYYEANKDKAKNYHLEHRDDILKKKLIYNSNHREHYNNLESLRRNKLRANSKPCVYLIWLGEPGIYYVGCSSCHVLRKSKWVGLIQGTALPPTKGEKYIMKMREIYQQTKFLSIKVIGYVETEQEAYDLERRILIKTILKHGDCYNSLN